MTDFTLTYTQPTHRPISLQNLQIGLAVQRSDSMPHPRYCSLKVYDLTATSDSRRGARR